MSCEFGLPVKPKFKLSTLGFISNIVRFIANLTFLFGRGLAQLSVVGIQENSVYLVRASGHLFSPLKFPTMNFSLTSSVTLGQYFTSLSIPFKNLSKNRLFSLHFGKNPATSFVHES